MRSLYLFVAGMLAMTAAPAAEPSFSKQVNADPKGEVDITNVAGSVAVTAWDKPIVDVQGTLESGVERVDVSTDGRRTIVKVVLPRTMFNNNGEAHLRIRVPAASDLQLSAVSADFTATGISGAQRLQSVSGEVHTEVSRGDADIKTVSGDVFVKGAGQPVSLRVQTVSGNVTVEHGAGSLEAVTVSGDVNAQLDPAKSLRLRSTSGDVQMRGRLSSGSSVDGETVSGNVALAAPPEGGYQYDLSSFTGDIVNCFRAEPKKDGSGPGSALSGTLGAGSGRVRIKTMSGDVSLCDH